MNQSKSFEENNSNDQIKIQSSVITENKDSINKDDVKIDFGNDECDDDIESVCFDLRKEKGEVNLLNTDNNEGNTIVVMAYGGERPAGLLVGTQPHAQGQQLGDSLQQSRYAPSDHGLQTYPKNQPPPNDNDENSILYYSYTSENRNRFIRLIMSIVFIMLLVTAGFIVVVLVVPEVSQFFRYNGTILLIPTMFVIMIVNYAMVCNSPCTKHPPCSIFFLFLAIVGMSLLSGLVTSYYSTHIILYAFVATTAVVFVCIILACSNFDFTSYLLYVIVIATAVSVLAMIVLTTVILMNTAIKPVFLFMLIITTLLQVTILTINLQLIIGGKTVELSERDYALGAYMVYMSIVDIFLKMVYIFGISGVK